MSKHSLLPFGRKSKLYAPWILLGGTALGFGAAAFSAFYNNNDPYFISKYPDIAKDRTLPGAEKVSYAIKPASAGGRGAPGEPINNKFVKNGEFNKNAGDGGPRSPALDEINDKPRRVPAISSPFVPTDAAAPNADANDDPPSGDDTKNDGGEDSADSGGGSGDTSDESDFKDPFHLESTSMSYDGVGPESGDTHLETSDMHLETTDTHNKITETHNEQTDTHSENTDTHLKNTDTHKVTTETHYSNTDTHYVNTDTHFSNTDKHYKNTDTHSQNTDTHKNSTETHTANTDTHKVSTETHYSNTDTHQNNTDTHYSNTDTHLNNTDTHYNNTSDHKSNTDTHQTNTDTHYNNTDNHKNNTDTHQNNTDTHYNNTDNHASNTTTHHNNTDTHNPNSSTHTNASGNYSGDPPPPPPSDCSAGAAPNRGEAEVNGSPSATIVSFDGVTCSAPLPITHRIVTLDTPRTRSLFGKLMLTLQSGDATGIKILKNGPVEFGGTGVPYTFGSQIQVVEHGHSGCGVHTWHSGTETLYVKPIKPGTYVFKADVDPDPEPEGNGVSESPATITVVVPPYKQHEVIYKTFIQCPMVFNPFSVGIIPALFEGDNRYFGKNLGLNFAGPILGSRSAQKVIVTCDPSLPAFVGPSLQQAFGLTKGWDHSLGGELYPGTPCPYALDPLIQPPPAPTATGTQVVNNSTLNLTITHQPPTPEGCQVTRIVVHVAGSNPLVPGAPDIKADYNIDIKECGGNAYFMVTGTHSKFPAHEMYIDTAEVLQFNPLLYGYTPLDLLGDPIPFGTGWLPLL